MPENEKGYLVCRHGKALLRQSTIQGEAHNIDIPVRCSRGTPHALVHTHPSNPAPSKQDLDTAKRLKVRVCVIHKGKTTCYKAKGG
jgi:hypothetical protein